jgi:hypothetical protein
MTLIFDLRRTGFGVKAQHRPKVGAMQDRVAPIKLDPEWMIAGKSGAGADLRQDRTDTES